MGVVQVDVMKEAYTQGLESEEDDDSLGDQIEPRDVGHNIYILAHQVRRGRKGPSSVLTLIKVYFRCRTGSLLV